MNAFVFWRSICRREKGRTALRKTMALDLGAVDIVSVWETLPWRVVVLGGHHEELPVASQALAEDTVGGGFIRDFGPGEAWYLRKVVSV